MYSLQLQGSKGGGIEVLGQLFLANEDFRGRVQRQHVAKEIQAVCPGATAVHLEIVQLWQDMQLKAVRRDCKVCQSACIITPVPAICKRLSWHAFKRLVWYLTGHRCYD